MGDIEKEIPKNWVRVPSKKGGGPENTKMRPDTWKTAILNTVLHIASKDYQEKSWFGKGDVISSPEELYCELFDDELFDDFLSSSQVVMTETQKQFGRQLKAKLENYSKIVSEFPNPKEIFFDPQWEEIRTVARKFLEAMSSTEIAKAS
jgi:hypothetical protein